jgi:hypothetical protein
MASRQRFRVVRLATILIVVSLPVSGALTIRVALAQGVCDPSLPGCIDPRAFLVRAYGGQILKNGGKCLDYTPEVVGSPVFLNDCSRAHPVAVSQLTERMAEDGCPRKYEVLLRAGTKLIGVRSSVPNQFETALELQDEGFRGRPIGPRTVNNQTFVLDGDSIILASDRTRVAKVQNSRGANGSAVVLGIRELTDSEFWEFHAIDGSGREPTCNDFPGDQSCAFVHVSGLSGLSEYLASDVVSGCPEDPAVGKFPDYDKVIVVDSGPIILSADAESSAKPMSPAITDTLVITHGVTIRGDRRGARLGPELAIDKLQNLTLFSLQGTDVRITGLRLRGGNTDRETSSDFEQYQEYGIHVHERIRDDSDNLVASFDRIIIDHDDLSDWTWRAVIVDAHDTLKDFGSCYEQPAQPPVRPNAVRVSRNFIHHNLVQNKGYGVNANSGGFPLVDGNTFVSNRHAIAATNATPFTGYRAWSNLVLSDSPTQYWGIFPYHTHDFDIHGTKPDNNGFDGIAGGYTGIFHNTFLSDNILPRAHFELRGFPCQYVEFSGNVSLQDEDATVKFKLTDNPFEEIVVVEGTSQFLRISRYPNQFDFNNPAEGSLLGVGDFDGDGRQDVLLATRAAWYYSPGGEAEWRLLSRDKTDPLSSLLFGDFDGDGRTDVIGKNGANINVSWGGVSEWERLNTVPGPVTDLAVGNFDGVGGDDIFWATGRTWYLSAGGTAPFLPVNTSSFRVRDLRFGDFDGNGKADVFGVVSGNWMFSDGATTAWTPLRTPRLTNTVYELFIGDFNNDGRDDVGHIDYGFFSFSDDDFEYWPTPVVLPGTSGGFTTLVSTDRRLAAWGRFIGGRQSELLFWDDEKLDIVYVGSGGFSDYSRQDMK